jgi:RNA polymerase sigma-70 factor (ECF subfamily)
MRFFADQSLAEIASELDVPLGTVKTWLHRGLARMKTALEAGNLESQKP